MQQIGLSTLKNTKTQSKSCTILAPKANNKNHQSIKNKKNKQAGKNPPYLAQNTDAKRWEQLNNAFLFLLKSQSGHTYDGDKKAQPLQIFQNSHVGVVFGAFRATSFCTAKASAAAPATSPWFDLMQASANSLLTRCHSVFAMKRSILYVHLAYKKCGQTGEFTVQKADIPVIDWHLITSTCMANSNQKTIQTSQSRRSCYVPKTCLARETGCCWGAFANASEHSYGIATMARGRGSDMMIHE